MSDHPNSRTIEALEKIITEMQFLVDHPRIQQRNWVAKGRAWIPVLHHAIEDLQREVSTYDYVTELHQTVMAAIERVGLSVEKRDETTWGFRWHGDALKGAYATRAEALEAGLRDRLQ